MSSPSVSRENHRFTEQASVQVKASGFPAYSRAGEQGPTFKHIEALDHLTAKATEYLTTRSNSVCGALARQDQAGHPL